jgi:TBC1 domain family member 2
LIQSLTFNCCRNLSKNSSSSRPETPPSTSSNHKGRTSDVPPSRSSGGPASPPFKSYINFLSNTNDDWKADEDEMLGYDDDDGDEFGLPSLSNTKRRTRRIATQNKSFMGGDTLSPGVESPYGDVQARRYSNDIAVERPAPAYPMPKKSEGKILRPQYKDILKGIPA